MPTNTLCILSWSRQDWNVAYSTDLLSWLTPDFFSLCAYLQVLNSWWMACYPSSISLKYLLKQRWKTLPYCSTMWFQVSSRLRIVSIWHTSVTLIIWNWFITGRNSHYLSHHQDWNIHWCFQKIIYKTTTEIKEGKINNEHLNNKLDIKTKL